ncbi:MAG: hypothetical protein Phyf2KO_18020 [Phycisphaerales bacterium]
MTQQAGQHTSDEPAAAGEERIDEIFLTPRVIDRKSFEQYAASLRQSLEETTRESDLLARRAEASAVVLERLERFVGSHSDIFERASQFIESIDNRQDSTNQLLDKITRQTESANKAVREIETLVRERGEAFEQRLITLATDALDRFETTRDELSKNAATLRRDLTDRLEQIRERGEAVIGTLEDRSKDAGETLATLLEEVDSQREMVRADTRDASRKLDEKASELRDEIVAESSGIKRELDTAARALREAIAAGSAHRDTIERAAELAVSRAKSGVGEQSIELERLARRAEKLIRDHRETIDAVESELRARALSAHEMVDRTIQEKLSAAQRDAGEVCDRLAAAVERAGSVLDESMIDSAVARAEAAKADVAETVKELDTANERAIADSEEARQSLIRSAEDIRGRSTQLIDRAEHAVAAAGPVLEQVAASCERAVSLTDRLEEVGGAVDARIAEQVGILMQERSLAMAEQIGVLEDRLERSEKRESVLRGVIESQAADISALREQMARLDQRITETAKSEPAEEPEPLVPVVRAKSPTRKKPAAKKKAAKKAAAKKTASKPSTQRKSSTKKAASKKSATNKAAAAKSETRAGSTKAVA